MYRKLMAALLVLLCFTSTIQAARRRFQLVVHNFTCTIEEKRLERYECDLKQKSVGEYLLSQRLMFPQKMGADFNVRIWIQIQPQNTKNTIRFLDLKFNVCQALQKSVDNPIIKRLLNEIIKSSNIPLTCPFKANFLYKVDNFSLAAENFPHYTPLLNFTYAFDMLQGKTIVGSVRTIGAIVLSS